MSLVSNKNNEIKRWKCWAQREGDGKNAIIEE